MGRGEAQFRRAFRAATRHSRHVRFLRRAIPVTVVVCGIVLVMGWWFNPLRMLRALPANFGDLVISGSKIRMEAPRLAGFTPDSRAYEFTAKSASQDLLKPDVVELLGIEAKVEMPDKATLTLSAKNGLFDSKADMLTLSDNILLRSPTYEGVLQEAVVDIRGASVFSDKPVELRMLQGNLKANRLQVLNSGEVVRFSGGVAISLQAGAFRGDAKTGAP